MNPGENPYQTPPSSHLPAAPPAPGAEPLPPQTDMRVMLGVLGLFVIVGGLACGGIGSLYVTVVPQSMQMAYGTPAKVGAAFIGICTMCALFALGFIWLGVGSMMARKWARDLLHALGWMWAGLVVIIVISAGSTFPMMMKMTQAEIAATPGGPPPGALNAFIGIILVFYAAVLVTPAILLILLYGLKNVRATVAYHDRKPRWTERVPMPVLVWWLMMVMSVISMISFAFTYPGLLASAGIYDNPALVSVVICLIMALLIWHAWTVAKMKPWAWTVALAMVIVGFSFGMYQMATIDMVALQRASFQDMGLEMPKAQEEMILSMYSDRGWQILPGLLSAAVVLGYLIWIRRYFYPSHAAS